MTSTRHITTSLVVHAQMETYNQGARLALKKHGDSPLIFAYETDPDVRDFVNAGIKVFREAARKQATTGKGGYAKQYAIEGALYAMVAAHPDMNPETAVDGQLEAMIGSNPFSLLLENVEMKLQVGRQSPRDDERMPVGGEFPSRAMPVYTAALFQALPEMSREDAQAFAMNAYIALEITGRPAEAAAVRKTFNL